MSRHAFVVSAHACECGCGQLTNLAPYTWKAKGWVKDQPIRFVRGHYRRDLMQRPALAERFWAKVDRRGPEECWPWIGTIDVYGYGALSRDGRVVKAHRMALELHSGVIPDNHSVCHRCDNPPCCNPAHLFAASQAENLLDMYRKGRARPFGRAAC